MAGVRLNAVRSTLKAQTMYTAALVLSIISSALFIVWLLMQIFGRKEEQQTITISGRIITRTVHTDGNGRVIDHI